MIRWVVSSLLLFYIAFECSFAGYVGDVKGWDEDVAVIEEIDGSFDDDSTESRGLIKTLKTVKIKKKCDCKGEKVCGCCMALLVKNETQATACFNLTDLEEEKMIEASLVFNDKKIYTKKIGDKKKCASVPYTSKVAKVCLTMYNMTVNHIGLHACMKLGLQLLSKEAVTFDFNCLLLSNRTLTVEKPSGNPGTGIIDINISKLPNLLDKLKPGKKT